MNYKHIVFDIDGTLIDTEYAVLHSLQKTLESVTGNQIDTKELKFALGITGKDALEKLNISDISSVLDLWEQYMQQYSPTVCLFKDMEQVLERLSLLNLQPGIVTSKTKLEFDNEFSRFGINKYFSTVICADDTLEHKPSPAPLLKYMELANVKSDEILYIGDSKYDMQCAHSAKIDFALAAWGNSGSDIKAEYYLEAPPDLLKLFVQHSKISAKD